jgi:hypothetical protein
MAEHRQIFRVRVPETSVPMLLEIRPAAIAEAQRLCPALLRAELVRLEDGSWLDLLTWSGRRVRRHHQDARPARRRRRTAAR